MKYTMGPRQSGKTARLIYVIEIKKKGILLVANSMMAQRVEELYPIMKGKVFTWDYWEHYKNSKKLSKFAKYDIYIDDAGCYLQEKFGYNLKGASMTLGDLFEDLHEDTIKEDIK